MKVLVLGWEYPPAVAGGLGAACHGLTTALARRGHEVVLAVPRAPGGSVLASTIDRRAPGIDRIEIDIKSGESTGLAAPLSPYLFTSVSALEGSAGVSLAPGSRTRATQHLYGPGLESALRSYTDEVLARVSLHDVDVVHAHDWMTVPAATRLRLMTGKPFCLHVHSTAFDRSGARSGSHAPGRDPTRRVEAVGVRTADRVIAVSGYGKRTIEREYSADPNRVHVVHNAGPGVPGAPPRPDRESTITGNSEHGSQGQLAPVSDAAAASGRSEQPKPPTVLFLGRLTRQKGAAFLLRAAKDVLVARPETRFVFVGDGDDRVRLIEMGAALGIASRVFFAGSIDDAARDRAYREATVFVLPSISEPFGLTPLEALRQGTPVILSDRAGVAEVLPSAPCVSPWKRAELAQQILAILNDDALRTSLIASGRSDAAELSWDRSAESLETILSGAVHMTQSPASSWGRLA